MSVYFVNGSTGSDSAAGTRAAPFLTASKARTVAIDGDTIVLVYGASTTYDLGGTIDKKIRLVGSGGQVSVVAGTAGTNVIVVAGADVDCFNVKASGATTAGVSGFRVQEGGRLNLVGCSSTGNDRAFTIADVSTLNATDTTFTNNTSVSSFSNTATGEFIRVTGMPAGTADTRGVSDRSGSVHKHTYLRGGVFYAAAEFSQPGNRTLYVEASTGSDTNEGISTAAPLASVYAAIRAIAARTIVLRHAAGGQSVYREGNSSPAQLTLNADITIAGTCDGAFNPVELRFSKAHTDWAVDTGTTYKRAFSFEPNQLWRNDVYADTLIKRLDGTTFPASQLPPSTRPWKTLAKVATVAEVNATQDTWAYVGGFLYTNLGANVNGLVEVPAEQSNGILIDGARVTLRNLVIRGANLCGILVINGGTLEWGNLYLLNNGTNGLDTTHGCRVDGRIGRSAGNGMDGIGSHMNSNVDVWDWLSDLNGDDGYSPHDGSRIGMHRAVAYRNADRGAVAINRGIMEFDDVLLDDNARGGSNQTPTANGQNLSVEDQAQAFITGKGLALGTIGVGGASQTNARALGQARIAGNGFRDLATGAVPNVTRIGTETSVLVDISDRDNVRREAINAAA